MLNRNSELLTQLTETPAKMKTAFCQKHADEFINQIVNYHDVEALFSFLTGRQAATLTDDATPLGAHILGKIHNAWEFKSIFSAFSEKKRRYFFENLPIKKRQYFVKPKFYPDIYNATDLANLLAVLPAPDRKQVFLENSTRLLELVTNATELEDVLRHLDDDEKSRACEILAPILSIFVKDTYSLILCLKHLPDPARVKLINAIGERISTIIRNARDFDYTMNICHQPDGDALISHMRPHLAHIFDPFQARRAILSHLPEAMCDDLVASVKERVRHSPFQIIMDPAHPYLAYVMEVYYGDYSISFQKGESVLGSVMAFCSVSYCIKLLHEMTPTLIYACEGIANGCELLAALLNPLSPEKCAAVFHVIKDILPKIFETESTRDTCLYFGALNRILKNLSPRHCAQVVYAALQCKIEISSDMRTYGLDRLQEGLSLDQQIAVLETAVQCLPKLRKGMRNAASFEHLRHQHGSGTAACYVFNHELVHVLKKSCGTRFSFLFPDFKNHFRGKEDDSLAKEFAMLEQLYLVPIKKAGKAFRQAYESAKAASNGFIHFSDKVVENTLQEDDLAMATIGMILAKHDPKSKIASLWQRAVQQVSKKIKENNDEQVEVATDRSSYRVRC